MAVESEQVIFCVFFEMLFHLQDGLEGSVPESLILDATGAGLCSHQINI